MFAFKHFFNRVKLNPVSPPTDPDNPATSWSGPKKRFDEVNLIPKTGKRGVGSRGPKFIVYALILTGLVLSFGYGLFLKQELLAKEQYLNELRAAGVAYELAAGSVSDRDLAVIEAQAKLLADIGQERDRWSKSLLLINQAFLPECYLTDIKESETGASLRGTCQSYADLVHFLASIEKQRLFSRTDILSSGFQPGELEISFEIFGQWLEVKAEKSDSE